ncbi:MAG TPA: CRTAC1 family protein, partial [Candidatus Kapabacteria bacterium]|nr:CRTAC1 family protein [Candidatus Kapabacteria bacterium]
NQVKIVIFIVRRSWAVVIMAAFLVVSCRHANEIPQQSSSPTVDVDSIAFTDITQQAGITWEHCNGAFGKLYLPEIKGSGCAIIDYNNDGWPDILFINAQHWPGHRTANEPTMALYRNNKNGTFTDVTAEAGLAIPMFGMGVAVGDYDNDGWDDLFITSYGQNHLFHNDHGVFKDVSKESGIANDSGWHTSAMFIDYDNDGKLDIFVCSYVDWTAENDVYCTTGIPVKTYCTPEYYHGKTNRLYHNNGDGTFTDVTKSSHIENPNGKGLGVAMMDFNDDGYQDIVVACDLAHNMLFRNNKDGTFTDIGFDAGIACDANGRMRSGMGIDCGDLDNDGKQTIVIGNFQGEPDWVFKQINTDIFAERAGASGIGAPSSKALRFAVAFADFDHDGYLDVISADGHVHPEVDKYLPQIKFRQPMQLYRNLSGGKFTEIAHLIPGPLQKPILGRGLALGDLNNDGMVDVVVTTNDSLPMVMLNNTKNGNTYLGVRLHGVRANRDGIGAEVTAITKTGKQMQCVRSGSSYCSASQLIANFGLGKQNTVDTLIVKWNAASADTLTNIPAGQMVVITEGSRTYEKFQPAQ